MLADDGKLIEAGWVAMKLETNPPQTLLDALRMAYMAGAQHLFSSIMTMMDPGREPTEADFRRMDMMDAWTEEMRVRALPVKRNA